MDAAIACNRFGLGARPGELAAAAADPRQWLLAQLGPVTFPPAPALGEVHGLFGTILRERRTARAKPALAGGETRSAALRDAEKRIQRLCREALQQSLQLAVTTPRSFAFRLLDFFSNHFSVSSNGVYLRGLAPALEREAIAPHLDGPFEHMLLAVQRHPAMLVYLNNDQSIGPDSPLGRKSARGLNENLAREILELHTLGVTGGYTQDDVRELAMAITGWGIGLAQQGEPGGFRYRQGAHQPGTRRLLGREYAQPGLAQGEAMLRDLARQPATARHLCFKLARHIVADEPPPALVTAMSERWLATRGDLRAVCTVLVEHPAAWQPTARKLKSPREFVVSALRALAFDEVGRSGPWLGLKDMGQLPFTAGSPAGWGDTADAWDGAEALLARIDWVHQLSAKARVRPDQLAASALGAGLREETRLAITRAESRRQGVALALLCPEFQRR